MKSNAANYAEFVAMTAKSRADALKKTAGTATSRQKVLAKILVAMVAANDCDEKSLRDHAAKAAACDIRSELQGVYELRIVFASIVAGKIALTEEQFDDLDGSKIALIATFLKPGSKLAAHAEDAVEKLKSGASAKDLRDFRATVNPGKSRKSGGAEANGVPVAFAVTDIGLVDPVLESEMLRDRIKQDVLTAYNSRDSETLEWHLQTAAKMLVGFAGMAGKNPVDCVADLLAARAAAAKGEVMEVEPVVVIETAAAAAAA